MTKGSRIALLYSTSSLLLLLFISSIAFAQGQLFVAPQRVVFRDVRTVVPAGGDLHVALQVYKAVDSEITTAQESFSVTLGRPLIDVETGQILDMERIAIGVNTYQSLQSESELQFGVDATGSVILNLMLKVKLFAAPGTYEGCLSIRNAATLAPIIEVPLTVEVVPWVALEVGSAAEITSATPLVPGIGSYIVPEAQTVAFVSANTPWVLLASTATAALEPVEWGNGQVAWEQLQLGIQRAAWFTPIDAQLLNVGAQPRVLGYGTATGDFGSGWVPLALASRLLFSREQSAGLYQGQLLLQATPLESSTSLGL